MEKKIKVNKYLGEKKEEILKILTQIIEDCDKIHIKAPVGSGKTTLMLDLIKQYPDKQFIMMFPQISITEQVRTKLTTNGIPSVVVNGSTLKSIIKNNSGEQTGFKDNVFLTTIDSASVLINSLGFTKENTIVISDETHTFLTSPRENHSNSVDSILRSGYPIIGLSATPDAWVNKLLFGIEKFIEVKFKTEKHPVVRYTEVDKGAIRTLAEIIGDSNDKLVVVFVESKKAQYLLKELIEERNPKTVCCLNADTKKTTEKAAWNYLMKNDELPPGTDVFILNSVVQAGINILNDDVARVYLLGEFDPFGFTQYLGRCRNYAGEFEYFHTPQSIQYDALGVDEIQERINLIKLFIDSAPGKFAKEIRKLIPLMTDIIYENGRELLPNKCKIANSIFEKLQDLSGKRLIGAVQDLFDDIDFEAAEPIAGKVITSAQSHAKARMEALEKLIDSIKDKLDVILLLFNKMNFDFSEPSMEYAIEKTFGGIMRLIYPGESIRMTNLMKTMKTAQISPKRLFSAAHLYKQSRKSEKVLEEYMALSNNTARDIAEAIEYFHTYKKTNPIIKKVVKLINPEIGKLKSADKWRKVINESMPIIGNSETLMEGFYKFSLQKQRSSGKLKLIGFNHSLKDYIKNLNLKHITVHRNKICPK
ncbi:MAG: DEAD/DEAH box helicase family protein [Prolixibacteraceae bacterium]